MKFKNLKIGQHLWVKCGSDILIVAKFEENNRYAVCGDWECGISANDCEIIELIDIPKGYEKSKMYYDIY